jgi:hypothetical protein
MRILELGILFLIVPPIGLTLLGAFSIPFLLRLRYGRTAFFVEMSGGAGAFLFLGWVGLIASWIAGLSYWIGDPLPFVAAAGPALIMLGYLGLVQTTGVSVFDPKSKEIMLRKGRKRLSLPFEKVDAVLIEKRETWGRDEYQVSIRTISREVLPIRLVGTLGIADRIRGRIHLTMKRADKPVPTSNP